MSWSLAKYADEATEQAKAICCGKQDCFDGRGCDTARWITRRMETTGYRLIRKPHLVGEKAT